MKSHVIVGFALLVLVFVIGCDNADKKKAQAERDRTAQGTKVNAGEYKAAPLDLSMDTPTPSPSNPKRDQ